MAQVIDLGGSAWSLKGQGPSGPIEVAANVPGQVHTDLLRAGKIGEPFNGTNQEQLKWIALSDWTYERNFTVSSQFLQKRKIQLISMGVDTVADIFLNGKKIFYTDNQFHRIRLDVRRHLQQGSNSIRVDFKSKVNEAAARAASCDTKTAITCPSGKRNPVQHGFDNQNYLRTEPCSFSWDWGPGFAPMGLWRAIYLQAYDTVIVRDITVVTTPHKASQTLVAKQFEAYPDPADSFSSNDQSDEAIIARAFQRTDRELDTSVWDARVTVYLDAGVSDIDAATSSAGAVEGRVIVSFEGNITASARVSVPTGGETSVTITLKNLTVNPWMPNGFGEQPLYLISAAFVSGETNDRFGGFRVEYPSHEHAIKGADGRNSVRVGFRTVELVQNPLPGGKSYFFKVTGVPIPVKGSNWIPADAFESRISRNSSGTTQLAPLFVALKESHQNMIRNWGGGIYQRDSFYDLADENGILIWEDLMFACADYWALPAFLSSAAKEIRDNVLRLQAHPSIALWAGNNEDERDMSKAPKGDTAPDYVHAYSLLTFQTGLDNVTAIDKSRPLSGSSPSDGNETADHPFSWNHQSEFYGDVHCYLYDVDNWDTTAYKRPRFMSEFGLQSWPSALTMATVFPPDQWSFSSDLSTNRNHHPQGQSQMAQQISMHFHLPKDCWPACNGESPQMYTEWSQMLWLSQLNQALGYKAEVEHFRRIRTDCSSNVPGCNMGRMYWQTNDIWQGASWAAVDYTGRYKMVQYFTKRFYAPFLVSARGSAVHGTFALSVINDFPNRAYEGRVEVSMVSWSDGIVNTWFYQFESPAASAVEIVSLSFSELLQKGKCPDATRCLLVYRAIGQDGVELSKNFLLLSPFYDVTTMRDPQLQVSNVTQTDGGLGHETAFDVLITSSATAAFVWAETSYAGRWSDNAVLNVDSNLTLTFYADNTRNSEVVTASNLKKSLQMLRGGYGRFQKPGQGGLWSLTDTSPEYTSNSI